MVDKSKTPAPPPGNAAELPAPRDRPSAKARIFSWMGSGPSFWGKVAIGMAVKAVVFGALIGMPEARTPTPVRTPTEITVDRETTASIHRGFEALHQAMRLVAPDGLGGGQTLDNLGEISISVRTARSNLLTDSKDQGLTIPEGTQITARIGRGGLSISADPGVTWGVDWLPDPTIERLTYNFAKGEFSAEASGLGPDSWYTNSVVDLANQELKARLPAPMREPGYNPYEDPQLEANLGLLIAGFTSTADPSSRAHHATDFSKLESPSISFDFRVSGDKTLELGDNQRAWVQDGTRVRVSIRSDGALTDPTLSSLHIAFSQPIDIAKGEHRPEGFGKMELNAINLAPNGQITLDYELGPEQAVDGIKAIGILLLLAGDPGAARGANINVERTRMRGLRADIQQTVDQQIEPRLVEQLRANDQAISGLSLLRFFGVE